MKTNIGIVFTLKASEIALKSIVDAFNENNIFSSVT